MSEVIEYDDLIRPANYDYKYSIPSIDDDGDRFGLVIEEFMKRMACHTHDGQTSNAISLNIQKLQAEYTSTEIWGAVAPLGSIMSSVTISADGYSQDSNNFMAIFTGPDTKTGPWERVQLDVNWITAATYQLEGSANLFGQAIKVIVT